MSRRLLKFSGGAVDNYATFSTAADGSILRSVIGRRSWRQWRAVTRFLLLQFCRNLPKQTGRERPHVDGLPRFDFLMTCGEAPP
jgi:hypothetical protein